LELIPGRCRGNDYEYIYVHTYIYVYIHVIYIYIYVMCKAMKLGEITKTEKRSKAES
jgi:hypothetical protein